MKVDAWCPAAGHKDGVALQPPSRIRIADGRNGQRRHAQAAAAVHRDGAGQERDPGVTCPFDQICSDGHAGVDHRDSCPGDAKIHRRAISAVMLCDDHDVAADQDPVAVKEASRRGS